VRGMNATNTPIKHTSPIRVGGVAAILGGLAATTLGLLYVLQERGITLGFIEKAVRKGAYEGPVGNLLLLGALAAIASLHFIQRRRYGRLGALASVSAIGGIAMVVIGFLVSGSASDTVFYVGISLLAVGVVVGSTGVVLLGIVTIGSGVLPRWCGVAVIAGSPPGVAIMFLFLTPLVMARALPGEIGWALAGIPWIAVGLAVFLAAGRRTEQASRVRYEN
jgi:hypothetical protein